MSVRRLLDHLLQRKTRFDSYYSFRLHSKSTGVFNLIKSEALWLPTKVKTNAIQNCPKNQCQLSERIYCFTFDQKQYTIKH